MTAPRPAAPLLEIVVVNLARSADRRIEMQAQLGRFDLPYSFYEAVDGKNNPHPLFERYDPRLAEIRRGLPLNAGELGCYASHYLLWEKSVFENKPLLIFEDDVEIDGNFIEAYGLACDRIEQYGLLRFSAHKKREYVSCEAETDRIGIIRFKLGPHGTSCYAISPQAAAKLIQAAKVWFEPVDLHLDRFWTHGVGSYGLYPFSVGHAAETAEQSEIWQGAKREKKSRRFRKLRALYRARDDVARFIQNLPKLGRWRQMP